MTRTIHILGAVAAAGGAAWLAKFGVIAATDGAVDDEGAAAAFYFLGLALMAAGAATVTLRAARGRLSAVAAAIAAPFAFFLSFMLLESIAKPIVGDAGPAWLSDEAGILATGAVWLAVGLASYRQGLGPAAARAAA